MGTIVRSALVGFSAEQLYALVEDIEAYPQFLPWCRKTEVLERRDGRTIARLSVGFRGINQSFTTENLNHPGRSIAMRLVEGPFSDFRAAWKFEPLGEHAAKIEYSMTYELSGGVLAKVLRPVFDHIADTMVEAFHRRAQALHGTAGN